VQARSLRPRAHPGFPPTRVQAHLKAEHETDAGKCQPDERERWLFFHARSEQPDTPSEEHLTHHIYIVEVVNEADGYARQKPLN
jgi:hypothetical protein